MAEPKINGGRRSKHFGVLLLFTAFSASLLAQEKPSSSNTILDAEKRAVTFLAKEVPAWKPANGCFSCHNNGDGMRALLIAKRAKLSVDDAAIADTLEFLKQPARWDSNGPEGPFNDLQLARVQFANALTTAYRTGAIQDRQPLLVAAEQLVANQSAAGAWEFSGEDVIGSPVTYGRPLAAAAAVQVLRLADSRRFAKPIAAAESWLTDFDAQSVLNAAAVVLGLSECSTPAAAQQRTRCLALIRRSQAHDGGWGPFVNSPPEAFDTAVVLCALAGQDRAKWGSAIEAGREFLRRSQLSNGSWNETTRPAGRDSYAQWIATTSWATIALIETREK